jgi:hypothetical protein
MEVKANLTYLSPQSGPAAYFSGAPGAEETPTGTYLQVPVRIQDARALPVAPALDAEGFCLVAHETGDIDFTREAEIAEVYYPRVAAFLTRTFSARRAVVFDHNIRMDSVQPGIRQPARHVHSDYTARSAARRAIELLDADDIIEGLQRRFLQVNFWRPIMHPVETCPLAVADVRSIPAEDCVKVDIVYPDRRGEIIELKPRPTHRWFYFSAMTPAEALVFKGFDAAPRCTARWTPHSAFDLPAQAGARPRASIELRAMLFF